MKTIYLPNGQECYLKEQIGEKYVVNKILTFEAEEGYFDVVDNTDIIVDKVYYTQPIAKISKEIKELESRKKEKLNTIIELEKQVSQLTREKEHIEKTQISNNKFILNRSELINAKTLALFPQNSILPIIKENENSRFRGITLNIEIRLCEGKERSWGHRLYFNEGYSGGDFLCPKYGILINPTQEEIDETIRKRLLEFEFSDYQLKGVDDKYLTPELLSKKNEYIASDKVKEREKLKKQLLETKEKLKKLK